jgi:hypothetical protein
VVGGGSKHDDLIAGQGSPLCIPAEMRCTKQKICLATL